MTDDWAKQKAREIELKMHWQSEHDRKIIEGYLIEIVAEAYLRGEEKMRERAANRAEDHWSPQDDDQTPLRIADSIRSLPVGWE